MARKRSLERQEASVQYDEYGVYLGDDSMSLYSPSTQLMASSKTDNKYDFDDLNGGGEDSFYDNRQWNDNVYDQVAGPTSTTGKLLPKVPIKHSYSVMDSMNGSNTMPTSKKTRRLPQPMTKATSRMLPQMPTISKQNMPLIRRSDTEYSDHDSLHSAYSYRPGAMSAIQFNEDYNYAYQSTDSLNTTTQSVLSEYVGRSRIAAFSAAVPVASMATKSANYYNQCNNQSASYNLGDNNDENVYGTQSLIGDTINYEQGEYDDQMSTGSNFYQIKYSESSYSKSASRKRLPQTPNVYGTGFSAGHAKQLPQIPSMSSRTSFRSTSALDVNVTPRKRLPVINSSTAATMKNDKLTTATVDDEKLFGGWRTDNAVSNYDSKTLTSNTLTKTSVSTLMGRNSNNEYDNNNKLVDETSADDVYKYNSTNYSDRSYDARYEYSQANDANSTYDNYTDRRYSKGDRDEQLLNTNDYYSLDASHYDANKALCDDKNGTLVEPYDSMNAQHIQNNATYSDQIGTNSYYDGYGISLDKPYTSSFASELIIASSIATTQASTGDFQLPKSPLTTAPTTTAAPTLSSPFSAAKATASLMMTSLTNTAAKVTTPLSSPAAERPGRTEKTDSLRPGASVYSGVGEWSSLLGSLKFCPCLSVVISIDKSVNQRLWKLEKTVFSLKIPLKRFSIFSSVTICQPSILVKFP